MNVFHHQGIYSVFYIDGRNGDESIAEILSPDGQLGFW